MLTQFTSHPHPVPVWSDNCHHNLPPQSAGSGVGADKNLQPEAGSQSTSLSTVRHEKEDSMKLVDLTCVSDCIVPEDA